MTPVAQDFLDGQYDVHVAKDANGLNTGSFYLRASPWTERFLEHVWEHNDGGAGESGSWIRDSS